MIGNTMSVCVLERLWTAARNAQGRTDADMWKNGVRQKDFTREATDGRLTASHFQHIQHLAATTHHDPQEYPTGQPLNILQPLRRQSNNTDQPLRPQTLQKNTAPTKVIPKINKSEPRQRRLVTKQTPSNPATAIATWDRTKGTKRKQHTPNGHIQSPTKDGGNAGQPPAPPKPRGSSPT